MGGFGAGVGAESVADEEVGLGLESCGTLRSPPRD